SNEKMSSWTVSYKSQVSAARMFKAAILDWHNLGPKLAPEIFQVGGTGVDGDHSRVGRIRQFSFTSAIPHFSHVKERLDFVDHDNFEYKASFVDGGQLGTKMESIVVHCKIVPSSSTGCICTVVTTAKPLPGIGADGEAVKWAKESVTKHFQMAENYLRANPDAYN
ncbi:pathogenesis-related BetVI family protein, partial [Klebsiella pneumoniae]|uniref:pathogenesis-related BetVI family protein n=1 Tax=Klebsiella pneumoniae TaxID=573 RepID=UPI002958C6F3